MGVFKRLVNPNAEDSRAEDRTDVSERGAANGRAVVDSADTYAVKSPDEISRISQRYQDPYEYMRNFLREVRQVKDADKFQARPQLRFR